MSQLHEQKFLSFYRFIPNQMLQETWKAQRHIEQWIAAAARSVVKINKQSFHLSNLLSQHNYTL